MRIVVACVVVLLGCKQAEDEVGVEWAGKDAEKSVVKLKAAIAANKPRDVYLECAQLANIDALKKSDKYKAVAAELEPLCKHDLQVALIKVAVEAAEAARKAKPDAPMLTECYEPFAKTASDDLAKYQTLDAPAKAMLARFAAACPDVKY